MPKGHTKGTPILAIYDYHIQCPHCDYEAKYFGPMDAVKNRCRLAWKLHCKKCPNGATFGELTIGRNLLDMVPRNLQVHHGVMNEGAIRANDEGRAFGGHGAGPH